MKRYKHKQTGTIVESTEHMSQSMKFLGAYKKQGSITDLFPAWIIENTGDWTLIDEEIVLTTEDNVPKYQDNSVYFIKVGFGAEWTVREMDRLPRKGELLTEGYKFFHDEEKAKTYVECNKPQYSLFEIGLALTRYNLADHFIKGILNNIKTKNNG